MAKILSKGTINLRFKADIIESSSEIQTLINNALRDQFRRILKGIVPEVRSQTRNIAEIRLKAAPEYQELSQDHSRLRGELGVVDGQSNLDQVIEQWKSTIDAKYIAPTGSKDLGRIEISGIMRDFSDVIDKPFSQFRTEKGDPIRWLQWLLLEGGKTLITGFEVEFVQLRGSDDSRTGVAIMHPSKNGTWNVPDEFQGTITNNWVTRALGLEQNNDIHGVVADFIEAEIGRGAGLGFHT